MPLSWNEIRSRSLQFSKDWATESSEHAEAKSFWDDFFNIFGVSRRRIASFEQHVKKIDGKDGFIDLLWKGVLLIEHKSRGKNLDRAHTQALDYFPGLKERDLPRYIMVSDFANFRLYDLDEGIEHEFSLEDLHKNINLFGFIAGYQTHVIKDQDPVNIKAAECMGKLHDQMQEVGYDGHSLELYLVRLLFCMFAEDTGIFERQQLQEYIEDKTNEDGSDLAHHLSTLFHVLNTPPEKRLKNRDEKLAAFPYINGKLFEEILAPAGFDTAMRQALLDSCAVDWSRISPAIFGSLFQSIMDKTARRNLGAHYTSEKNILKLINPLFMDDLRIEFIKSKNNKKKLLEFHNKLRTLTFFDPACGCGNFLVVAYRELRLLELDVLRAANKGGQMAFDIHQMIKLNVDQFYGIEIEEFPSQIAQVALWLMDHQMNLLVSEEFGLYFARIPLKSSAHIVHGNALKIDWSDVIPAENLSYIMGNPPFGGKHYQTVPQRLDLKKIGVDCGIKTSGDMDFVCGWFLLSSQIMKKHTGIKTAFVTTNSITQGEQVPVLWTSILTVRQEINFAHRTFKWKNEASGVAAVHCVIIGFSAENHEPKRLFDYESLTSDPFEVACKNISPYLIDSPSVIIKKATKSLFSMPIMRCGNKPSDGGNLIFTNEEKKALVSTTPSIDGFLREYVGSREFINGNPRWCLWLKDLPPEKIRSEKIILERVKAVKEFRLSSTAEPTQKAANRPTEFFFISQPKSRYIAVPEVSSERRDYIPIGFLSPETIASNKIYLIDEGSLYIFGMLQSSMHMMWTATIGGRLKSDYQYSASMVYNTFPWPSKPTEKQKKSIEEKAQAILDARAQYPSSTLADLYDPLTMPATLLQAHQVLDKAVDLAYGKKSFKTEAERIAFLFNVYQEYTSLLPKVENRGRKRKNG